MGPHESHGKKCCSSKHQACSPPAIEKKSACCSKEKGNQGGKSCCEKPKASNHSHSHSHSHSHGQKPAAETESCGDTKKKGCCSGTKSVDPPSVHSHKATVEGCNSQREAPATSDGCQQKSHVQQNQHDGGDSGCSVKTKDPATVKPTCVAVLNEDKIIVYDIHGKGKSFYAPSKKQNEKLCFSSHGAKNVDEYLTPCFTQDGTHGEPDEGCFCGVEEAHLHAHVFNKAMCGDSSHGAEANLMNLAKVTLLAKDEGDDIDDDDDDDGAKEATSIGGKALATLRRQTSVPASESNPVSCNSKEVAQSRKAQGFEDSPRHHVRMFQVWHEDHRDYLVHNKRTGNLHLEHPCNSCGDTDLHGKLNLVSKREWDNDDLTTVPDDDDEDSDLPASKRMRLHFYEAPKTPMLVLDLIFDLFSTDTTRSSLLHNCANPAFVVNHAMASCCASGTCSFSETTSHADPNVAPVGATSNAISQSSFHVKNICCASEIPAIDSIVKPLAGVERVTIITTTKTVYVHHDASKVTAEDIALALNKESFGCTVKVDGGKQAATAASGRSQFHVSGMCCSSEIPQINTILGPLDGITNIAFNVPNRIVFVDHEFGLIGADRIAEALNREKLGAKVLKDAGKAVPGLDLGTISTKFVESTFRISLLDDAMVETMTARLKELPNVAHVESHIPSVTIKVDHDPHELPASRILAILSEGGRDVSIIVDGLKEGVWTTGESDEIIEEHETKLEYTVIASGVFWIISMLSFIGGNWDYLKYVALVSVAFGMPKIAIKASRTLRRCHFDANCMMLFAVLGALALQEFTEAAAVAFLFGISAWLETISTARARNALSVLVKLRPDRAKVQDGTTNRFVVVPASAVRVGHVVSVCTGDKIPCDGYVLEGSSAVDESSLTGESRPIRKVVGDFVSGGTINTGVAQLLVKATSTVENSAVSRLIRLVEEAQANRSPTEHLIDAFAKRYTPVVVLASILMCSIPWAFGTDVGLQWTNIGLVTIVIACPCALIISTPVTYVAGIAAAAQRGIVVKGGAHLEALGRVDHICLDKTGTLTEGSFGLLDLKLLEATSAPREEVLSTLAAVESRSNHPIGTALVAAAANEKISYEHHDVVDHCDLEGEGLKATVDGKEVFIGNPRLFKRLGTLDSVDKDTLDEAEEWAKAGRTVGLMSIEGTMVCAFCVADAIREEAPAVVKALGKLDIQVTMLTGDNSKAALAIGTTVGLTETDIRSQLLPREKLDLITGFIAESEARNKTQHLKRRGLILMCGDGVNDAPALAAADVGVAMGAGAALAMETADVTLLDSNLNKLLKSVELGRRVTRTIIENVTFSLGAKAIVMGFTFAGYTSLWFAIASDVGAMLIVTLNGMKLLPSKKSITKIDLTDPVSVEASEDATNANK